MRRLLALVVMITFVLLGGCVSTEDAGPLTSYSATQSSEGGPSATASASALPVGSFSRRAGVVTLAGTVRDIHGKIENYVLDVRGSVSAPGGTGDPASRISTVPADRLASPEGVTLQPSKSVRSEEFAPFVGRRVEVQGAYIDGERYRPPKGWETDGSQHLMPSKDPNTGQGVWPIVGAGFRVDAIRVAPGKGF